MANIPEVEAPVAPPEVKAPEVKKAIISSDDKSPVVSQRSAMKAEFLDTCIRVDLGKGYTKLVDYQDFYSALGKLVGQINTPKADKVANFILPNNVFMMKSSASNIQISCFYPAGTRDIIYRDDKRKRVHPNIIISHSLNVAKNGWAHNGYAHFFCTDLQLSQINRKIYDKPVAAERIWLLPFANMYDNATMCLGANQLPRNFVDHDLRPLNAYYDVIFNSPFNDDLGVKALSRNAYDLFPSTKSWFDHLATLAEKNEEFPYKHLTGFTART